MNCRSIQFHILLTAAGLLPAPAVQAELSFTESAADAGLNRTHSVIELVNNPKSSLTELKMTGGVIQRTLAARAMSSRANA